MTNNALEEAARYELKFSNNSGHYHNLTQWIMHHEMGFKVPYPSRQINNVYFDTYDLDSYLENMAGISSRTKLRLRWYGDVNFIGKPTLELKIKRNKLGWKKTAKVDFNKATSDVDYSELKAVMHSNIDEDMSNRLYKSDFPVLINSYERDYFVSSDGSVRVTVDRRLKFYDQRSFAYAKANTDFHLRAPEVVILEVKTAAKDINNAANVIRDVPMPPTKSSKYVIGVQSALGY